MEKPTTEEIVKRLIQQISEIEAECDDRKRTLEALEQISLALTKATKDLQSVEYRALDIGELIQEGDQMNVQTVLHDKTGWWVPATVSIGKRVTKRIHPRQHDYRRKVENG